MKSVTDIAALQQFAKGIVRKCKKAGTLKTLTPRMVREEVEKKFALDPGTLDAQEHKNAIREAISAVLEEDAQKGVGEINTNELSTDAAGSTGSPEPSNTGMAASSSKSTKQKERSKEESDLPKHAHFKGKKTSRILDPAGDKPKKVTAKPAVQNASRSSKGVGKYVSDSSSPKRPKSGTSDVGASGEGGKHTSPIVSRPNYEQKAKPRKDKEATALSSEERVEKKHMKSSVTSSPSTSFGRKSSTVDNAHTPLKKGSKPKAETDTMSKKGKERETEPSPSKGTGIKSPESVDSDDFEGVREISKSKSKSSSQKRKSQLVENPDSPKRSKKSNTTKISEKGAVATKEKESSSPSLEKQKGKKVGTFKSSRVIETSDEEDEPSQDVEIKANSSGRKPPIEVAKHHQSGIEDGARLQKAKRPQSSPKMDKQMGKGKKHVNTTSSKHPKGKHPSVDELSESSDDDVEKRGEPSQKVSSRKLTTLVDAESDSSLSTLVDEPPKQKRGKKDKGEKGEKEPRTKKTRKALPGLSKDEEIIKRLKSLVVACGVRKVWSKEFQGLDTPSAQIKRLKDILTSLGMVGKISLERAKAIRAKRELAQELADVVSFDRAVNKKDPETESANDVDVSDEDDEGNPTKRKTAARSIEAFLADQSDSD